MAIFFNKDVRELLENKKVIVIGDSIQRSVYKDLICLWTQDNSRYLFQRELRAKGELAFLGDKLLLGGKLEGKMVNGISYREVREFSDGKVFFKYYFVTRSYSEHMASILNELKTCQPDVVVMNSTFWDLHHYGDSNLQQYKENLDKLLKDITEMFPSSLLFIWNAALPLADRCKGGFLRRGFLTIPIDKIKTANKFAWLATTEQKKVYLDLFSELKDKENFQQAEDGIHWGMRAHRKISNLILTELCTAWNKKIPDPPPQEPKRPDNRNSSPVPWSSFYPDNDNWSSSPVPSYNDGYDLDYWNYVPYRESPSFDRYQTSPPLLYGASSPYTSSWSNIGWGFNLPFGNIAGRAREYQTSPPAPFLFQRRYLPVEDLQFNFSTPQGPYYPGTVLFKPANYSDPLPFCSNAFGQGLLPTPLGPPSYAVFNEGDRYRDRFNAFKKLSNPRTRRYKSSATNTTCSTPLSTTSQTKQSASNETPLNSLRADQNTNDNPDHNNNQKQNGPVNEACSKASSDSDNVDVGTGGPSIDTPNQPTNDSVSSGGSGDPLTKTTNSAQLEEDAAKMSGVKRKHEDDEESNPSKIPREESTDVQRCGVKRKHDDSEAADGPKQITGAQEDSCPLVDDAVACENKKRRGGDEATEIPNALLQVEGSSLKDNKEKHTEVQLTDKPSSPGCVQDEGNFHDVRCALSYDSFI